MCFILELAVVAATTCTLLLLLFPLLLLLYEPIIYGGVVNLDFNLCAKYHLGNSCSSS